MQKLHYEIEFLGDIVLPATSNTEGNIIQLEFIPGSNFLGMVAKNYDKFENKFQIFHSGDVKFGDATIFINNKQTYKLPYSYYYRKLKDKTLYNHHLIKDFTSLGQLKQKRKGYITQENDFVEIEYSYLQKSAYDNVARRSKEAGMYGYMAIKAGCKWHFSITYTNISQHDLELLDSTIEGKQRLGKSKSAQYGLINIKKIDAIKSIKKQASEMTIIYAKSRLALVDDEGNATLDLRYLFDGLESKNIDYEKTQLRTTTFTPYNTKRQTKDYERIFIEKGSVIVLKDVEHEKIPYFVGVYQNEGFGEILLNPTFVMQNEFTLQNYTATEEDKEKVAITTPLAKFLKHKEDAKLTQLELLDAVDSFVQKYKNLYKKIPPSQWGKIRSICNSHAKNIEAQFKEYISGGTKKWEQKQINKLLDENYSIEFIKLIAIQMPKQGANNE